MASTSTPNHLQPAPWKSQFLDHLSKMDSPEFVFSSLHPAPNKDSPVPFLPRARYCIYRGMWAELPENKHNDADRNEKCFESEMPTFTTDVRMQKTFEVFASSSGKAKDESQSQGSGGGGPCEAVWWVKGDTMVQWRMQGEAFVVGNDVEGGGEESSGVRTVKSELGSRMRVVKEEGKEEWSWKKEVRGHFGNISPGMRGSFKNPPPGQAVSKPFDEGKNQIGQKVENLDDEVARSNFRVVVIKPEMVESIDLSDPVKARRHQYRYDESSGEWSHTETWP
ncbi:hypothetical protein LTR62_005941 [Meristemomyces frigidus]|uniref:Pyridoxamine 5'-phosphate oxidase Alr4036 family FMN-binding domain-containing protein n=1 Tax=Meristemomyces frigidus TaxID=1508187 RepID=A0AAN7TQM3_9PEZI|nr:hypothetical protein LTR62_005941 [Meristemomyces frigidus]